MTSYDIPNTADIYSKEEAEAALNKFHAEVQGDPNHPYTNNRHPQHKEFTEAVTELHKIKTEYQDTPEIDFTETEALQRRVKEAERLMKILVNEYNYKQAEIPEDITPAHIRGLKQQRLAGQKNFGLLSEQLEVDLRDTKAPPDILAKFDSFRNAPDSDRADELIRWIFNEKKKRGFLL